MIQTSTLTKVNKVTITTINKPRKATIDFIRQFARTCVVFNENQCVSLN
jgi:hypothetical protein